MENVLFNQPHLVISVVLLKGGRAVLKEPQPL